MEEKPKQEAPSVPPDEKELLWGRKVFTFHTDEDSHPRLHITVNEICDADYALFTWPSSPVLAQYLFHHADDMVRGKTILEIGCGTSLPGITAAKIASRRVFLTDKFPHSCPHHGILIERNLRENDITFAWWDESQGDASKLDDKQVILSRLRWSTLLEDSRLFMDPEISVTFDLIIASDCFYDESDFENILCTVNYLLRTKCSPDAYFLTSYEERHSDWNIKCLLNRWNLVAVSIPLAEFNATSSNLLGSTLPGQHTIHLLKMRLKCTNSK